MITRLMNQIFAASLALFLLFLAVSISAFIYDLYEKSLPVSNWVTVDQLLVSDSVEPKVTFTRSISRDLVGTWSAEVHRISENVVQVCQGSGTSTYTRSEHKTLVMSLDRFVGEPRCNLSPGRYVLNVAWRMTNSRGVSKVLTAQSNAFIVPAR